MAWSCCKDNVPAPKPPSTPMRLEVPTAVPRNKNQEVLIAYILEHEEDDDDEEEEQKQKQKKESEKEREQEQRKVQEQEQEQRREQDKTRRPSKGQDDDIERPCTSKDAADGTEAETQTNPRYFPKSPKKITLDEILLGMQKIEYTISNTMRDFEQRLSRLEQIVLKMRNAWIHHRTCHLEGLEYDDEQD
uniref:histone H3.v1-like n=1 Tax=Podarcis muralis TaxID=64176 RepID=UPI00109EE916|nr:histone H3.v1-like [Podarcis muralis]